MALIVIPYFKVNIEAEGLFLKDRARRLRIFYLIVAALSVFLLFFKVYAAFVPTLIMPPSCCWQRRVLRNRPRRSAAIWRPSRFPIG